MVPEIIRGSLKWLMSRQKSVKVYSFSGADTEDTEHFLQPLINKKPDQIILHIGKNDVSNGVSVKQATEQIVALCEKSRNSWNKMCLFFHHIKRR